MTHSHSTRALAVLGAAAFIALAIAGCSSSDKDPAALLDALESNKVVAVANGKPVLAGPAAEILRGCMAQYLAVGKTTMPADLVKKERDTIVERLVVDELVRQRLEQSTATVNEAMINAEIANHVTNMYHGDAAKFNTTLAKAGLTPELLRDSMREELRKIVAMDEDMKPEKVTIANALAYYRAHSNDFVVRTSVTVRHILLKCGAEATGLQQTQMIQRLEGIRREIVRGTKFEDAARKYSQCPSAKDGGMLGPISDGDSHVSELFLRAALRAPVSNVSRVVETEYGFHLLYVTEKRPQTTATFSQVSSSLMNWLFEKERTKEMEKWRRSLRTNATVEYK